MLHDVIEDTDITIEMLAAEGFPDSVLTALQLLTHDEQVPYLTYVGEIKTNPIASVLKIADLKHNSDLTRLDRIDEKALARVEKYKKAIELLST